MVQDREGTISSAECRAKVVPSLSRKKYHVSDAIVVHVSDWTGQWCTRRRLKSAVPIAQEDKDFRRPAGHDQVLIPISIGIRKQIGRAQAGLRSNCVGAGGRKTSLAISMEDVQDIGGDHKIEIPVVGESNRGHPLRKLLLGRVGGDR